VVVSVPLTRDGDRHPVRVWAADAATGAILDEISPLSGSSWSTSFGGGECGLTVDLNLPLRDGTGWDWSAITYLRGMVTPWKRTVVVTQGQRCLGEWLLTNLEPQGYTQLALTGAGWEQYPASRALKQRYKWASGTDQMRAARTLLLDAFSGITITIPAATDSGQDITPDDRFDAWSTDYGQALDQVCDTDNGLEWAIVSTVDWAADRPTTVTRTVVWGYPEIARSCPVTARRPAPGERGGNVAALSRPVDAARLVTKAVVLGRGSGKKQVKGSYTNEALLAAGYLSVVRVFSEPTIKKSATAARRAKRKVTSSEAQLLVPGPVSLRLVDTEEWPQVGDLVGMAIEATPADPVAVTGSMRVGKASWTVTAGTVDVVTVEGVDQ
jgi:hypothetical protein